jgi:hypothetical protein
LIATLSLALLSSLTSAADLTEESFFGVLDGAAALRPDTTQATATVANGATQANAAGTPIYLHVRPNAQQRWSSACTYYKACNLPVYFVTEAWYRNAYLPAVGGQNGLEQRYRDTVRADRTERDTGRHRHSE